MKINKIQILIPGGGFYGGIESLHQLAHLLKKNKFNSKVIYVPVNNRLGFDNNFKKNNNLNNYSINLSKEILDEENILTIIPETFTGYVNYFKKSKLAIWWLSVDNYFKKKKSEKLFLKRLINFIFNNLISGKDFHYEYQLELNDIKDKNIFNLCQSQYAFNFLKKRKFKRIYYLCDYIHNRINNKKVKNKKYDVALNYHKGEKFNNEFIKNYSDILKFKLLKDLNLKESQEMLSKSKIFVDFGNHPGRDRMPRETVTSKTNILILNKGAAAFFKDLPIKKKYKFDEVNFFTHFKILQNILLINKKFKFNNYRKKIVKDKIKMTKQIIRFMKIINYEN